MRDLDIDKNVSDNGTDLIKTDRKYLNRIEQALTKQFFVCSFLIAKINVLILYKKGISSATDSTLRVQPSGILCQVN